jgi:hypothetical protein
MTARITPPIRLTKLVLAGLPIFVRLVLAECFMAFAKEKSQPREFDAPA